MARNRKFDLAIIGSGPAGYVGAIRAAQLGLNTVCIERDRLGGVCLNWGCIPTKALLAGAEFYHRLKHDAGHWGILADNVRHDWPQVIQRSRGVAGTLNKGVQGLLKKNKIEHIAGEAKVTAPGKIEIATQDGSQHVQAKHIIIATGASPRPLPGVDFDGQRVINSREAMTLEDQPGKLLIVGAGAIGMEFAYFYNAFGTEVTVIEMLDHLLPNEDEEVSKAVEKSFKKQGVSYRLATKTLEVKPNDSGVELVVAPVKDESKTETLRGDRALIAIGVQGNVQGVLDDSLGVEIEKGHIKVDRKTYATNVAGLYAVGDVIGPPWLAHVASEEAVACVERIAGAHAHDVDYDAIPACTYCHPQVASLGRTEQALKADGKKAGEDYNIGRFPFQASGKAQALGSTEGFVKIITDTKHGEILGVHMVGENVTELLAELGLAKRLEATHEEIIATMHAHPTLSEAIHEAALGTQGRTLNF